MYFTNMPQSFGQAPVQNTSSFINTPMMGYNQGIGGLQYNAPQVSNPAPQMGNISGFNQQANTPYGQQSFNQQPPMQQSTQAPFTPQPSKTPLQSPIPRPRAVAGQAMARGGVVQQTLAKGGAVANGIAALRGEHPNPRAALDNYDRLFGTDATAELMRAYADGGVVSGPGSGVADLVPGSIDGREDVRIASGEYVVPAWAVAALGDGSTEAGAKVLDAMVARLREAGSELIMGSEPINPSEFLPG